MEFKDIPQNFIEWLYADFEKGNVKGKHLSDDAFTKWLVEVIWDLYPRGVCRECGRKYLTEEQKKEEDRVHTAWKGQCTECKGFKDVTDWRHYNYLNVPKIDYAK